MKFDFLGLKTLTVIETARELLARRGIALDPARLPLDDPRTYRAPRARRHGRRVPARRRGHARCLAQAEARPLRGHHRHRGALSPGPDGQYRQLCQPQARARAAGLSASADRADPGGDLRRHHLPGAGDADRARAVRLLARRGRSAPPRHGQEDQEGDGAAARRASSRAPSPTASSGRAPSTSSSWWRNSPATASTSPTPRPMR